MRPAPIAIAITARLELREFMLDDAVDMQRLNDDPEVVRYTGDPPFASVAEARELLAELRECYERDGFSRWATFRRDTGAFIGWCGLNLNVERAAVDVGFRFFRDQWGQGYATEAALESLRLGFERFNVSKIVGRAMHDNAASHRVLIKLGMQPVHTLERDDQELVEYEITAHDWQYGIRRSAARER